MSDTMRIINRYFDVENGYPVISNTDPTRLPSLETLYAATQVLYRAHLLNADGSYFAPDAASVWKFGINDVLDGSATGKAVTLNADFNDPLDWSSVSAANGKICWPIDLTQEPLKSFMASKTALTVMYCALWMQPPGGKWDLKCQWQIDMWPIAIDPTTAAPIPGQTFETVEHALASYVLKKEDGARVIRINGVDYHYCEADGKYVPMVMKKINGVYHFVPGEGITL